MKQFFEMACTSAAVLGTLVMIGAVGYVETDQFLKGGIMAGIGIVLYILAIYAQEAGKDDY